MQFRILDFGFSEVQAMLATHFLYGSLAVILGPTGFGF
jgi:hypothetical protein